MSIILLLILITYQTVASVMDMCDIKKRKGIDITEKMRLDFYKETIIWGWAPVCIIFLLYRKVLLRRILDMKIAR